MSKRKTVTKPLIEEIPTITIPQENTGEVKVAYINHTTEQDCLAKQLWCCRLLCDCKSLYYHHRKVLVQKVLVLLFLLLFWKVQFWPLEIPVFWLVEILNLIGAFAFQFQPQSQSLLLIYSKYASALSVILHLVYIFILTFFLFRQWVIYIFLIISFVQSYYYLILYRNYFIQKVKFSASFSTVLFSEAPLIQSAMHGFYQFTRDNYSPHEV